MIDLNLAIDLGRGRLTIMGAVPLRFLADNGPIYALIVDVCGKDAVADGVISSKLGVTAAFRKPSDTAWLTELSG